MEGSTFTGVVEQLKYFPHYKNHFKAIILEIWFTGIYKEYNLSLAHGYL